MKLLLKYLAQGLLLLAPLLITIFLLVKLFYFLNELIPYELIIWSGKNSVVYVGDIPGLGIVLLLSVLLLIGFVGSSFIADPIIQQFNKIIQKIPLVKVIYDAIKDLLTAFVGNKKKFNQAVIFKEFEGAVVHRIGFITQNDVSELTGTEGLCAVYLPHSYALSGVVVFVEKSKISTLDIPAGKMMKFIVSGGIISLAEINAQDDGHLEN